jgi:hypothetical protein
MAQGKRAQLTGNLVAKKGEATPSVPVATSPTSAAREAQKDVDSPSGYYKSLTVKLDRRRYEALKTLGIKQDMKSQEIFVEALDAYLQAKSGSRP